MATIYESVVALVGTVPSGCEPIVYVLSCVVLLFLLQQAFGVIYSIVNWIGGK